MNVIFITCVGRARKRQNIDAFCAIVTSLVDSILILIQKITKIIDVWNIFHSQYETRNQIWIQNLKNQLVSERLQESEVMELFIIWMKNIQDQMVAIRVAKTSDKFVMRYIYILFHNFDELIIILNIQMRDFTFSFEKFNTILLEEKIRLKSKRAMMLHLLLVSKARHLHWLHPIH